MSTPEIIAKANKILLEQSHQNARMRSDGIFQLAILGLRSLILLNGGAIVALFTLLGHIEALDINPASLWWGFAFFIIGTCSAVFANLLGYIAQNQLALYEMSVANETYISICRGGGEETDPTRVNRGNYLLVIAIIATVISLVAFGVGSGFSLAAVHVKSPTMAKPLLPTSLGHQGTSPRSVSETRIRVPSPPGTPHP